MQANIKEMSIVELKAMAYETFKVVEVNRNNLRILEEEIKSRPPVEVVKDK